MINLSGLDQTAKLVKPGALKDIRVESLKTKAISDTAFKLLKLDQAGDDVFMSPQLHTWINYLISVTKTLPTIAMLSTLTARYSDDVLIKMLEAAKKNPGTEEIATRLQGRQVKIWMRSGKTADDIFKLLKLDYRIEDLLTNPNLATYVTYMNLFNKYSPGRETTLANTFVKSYGNEAVAKMVEAAKKVPSTEKFAQELQVALFNQWLMKGARPRFVWERLRMKSADPDGAIWRRYSEFYTKHGFE
ncbi:hypothetical protein PC128_g6991 [Phytophthora cactorum]|nr:hypothetical protein PC120_g11655 [Phytophthora cactorum]KAG3085795.1 hypothetical protein PC121_g5086 [Phytophthora cactorum]KAG3197222.1 hypothetical protein PC128_g6991 [Phytophthora cactorum]